MSAAVTTATPRSYLTSTVSALIGCEASRRLRGMFGACAGKAVYSNAEHAGHALALIRGNPPPGNRPTPAAAYGCPGCGKFHLTSQGARP